MPRQRLHAKLDEVLEHAVEEEDASIKRAAEEGPELIPTTLMMFGFTSDRKSASAGSGLRRRS